MAKLVVHLKDRRASTAELAAVPRSVSLGDEREDGNRLRDSFGCCTECTELYRRNENGGWSSRRSKCKELNLLATGEIGCGGQI
jgi:hypothetical protein